MKKQAIGISGLTSATLFDTNNNIIGRCLDTPNCVACAFGLNSNIKKAKGILGFYEQSLIDKHLPGAMLDKEIHITNIHFS